MKKLPQSENFLFCEQMLCIILIWAQVNNRTSKYSNKIHTSTASRLLLKKPQTFVCDISFILILFKYFACQILSAGYISARCL